VSRSGSPGLLVEVEREVTMIRLQSVLPVVLVLVCVAGAARAGDVDPAFAVKLDSGDADAY